MDSRRRRILESVLALFPASAPPVTRVGIELECFVDPTVGGRFGWDHHLAMQERLRRGLLSRTPTAASLDLEPGGQWELRSVALDGPEGLRAFARDARRIEEWLRDQDCRVAFQGIRPGGTAGRVISPDRRARLLLEYLQRRSRAAAAMMADTAACQLTLDPMPWTDALELLRAVVRSRDELERRWNAWRPGPSRRGIWANVDPERCVPPRGMIEGTWSDEACLDHILSRPSIAVAAADGRLMPFEGSFYDAVAGLPIGDDLATCFGRFMKHIYYPVKPRVMPELRLLDSREPERLAELEHLLAVLGLPSWCSGARRPVASAAAFSAVRVRGPLAVLPRGGR
jgi:gamma-glutamylcysteine synthetase